MNRQHRRDSLVLRQWQYVNDRPTPSSSARNGYLKRPQPVHFAKI